MLNLCSQGKVMSLNKHTKAELLEMLSSKGIDAKSSMKKSELIELLEGSTKTERDEAALKTSHSTAQNEANTKPSVAQPVLLVVGVFVILAVLAWMILG
jgi:hypothetical protein